MRYVVARVLRLPETDVKPTTFFEIITAFPDFQKAHVLVRYFNRTARRNDITGTTAGYVVYDSALPPYNLTAVWNDGTVSQQAYAELLPFEVARLAVRVFNNEHHNHNIIANGRQVINYVYFKT